MNMASADRLRSMVDTTDEQLRMLQRFNIDTKQWSSIVCVVLLNKLDSDTRNQWETKADLPEMPDFVALSAFLEQRILAIRNVEQSGQHQQLQSTNSVRAQSGKPNKLHDSGRYQPYNRDARKPYAEGNGNSKGEQRSQQPPCPKCGPNVHHFLWKCDGFKQLPAVRQEEELARWGICKICLVSKHSPEDCTRGTCPVCKTGKHNSAICPKAKKNRVNHVRAGKADKGAGKQSTE